MCQIWKLVVVLPYCVCVCVQNYLYLYSIHQG